MALATASTTTTTATGSTSPGAAADSTAPETLASSAEAADLSSAIEAIASFVSGFEAGRYAGEDAATLVAWFTRAERLCAAGKTVAAARVAESHGHLRSGHRTPAEWLASVTGESMGEAIDVLQLADTFRDHPDVDQAFRDGKLSRSGAKLVAGAVRVNPEAGEKLVDGAQHDTFRQLRQRCLNAKAEGRSEEDAARADAAIRAKRRCRTWTDTDGAFRLDALLTPDAGAALAAALAVESNRRFAEARTAGQRESGECYAADALVALVTAPPAEEGTGSTSEAGRTPGGGARAIVTLRVDLDALQSGSLGPDGVCEIPGVGPVPLDTARSLMGDAITTLVVTNGVDVTTVCHLGRSIPRALRTAVVERDRVCVVPGCDVSTGLEIDHWMVDFAAGGPAKLANLARLCHHHHYLRTHRGFQLSGGPGRWQWEPPATPKPRRRKPKLPSNSTPASGPSTVPAPAPRPGIGARREDPTGDPDPPLFAVEE
jgi:hypothetical protein